MPTRRSFYVEGMLHGPHPVPSGARLGPLFASSLINGVGPDGAIPGRMEDEALNLIENIRRLLAAAGGSLDDVVMVSIDAVDYSIRQALDPAWESAFPDRDSRPARHVRIGVPVLPTSHFEADVIAFIEV